MPRNILSGKTNRHDSERFLLRPPPCLHTGVVRVKTNARIKKHKIKGGIEKSERLHDTVVAIYVFLIFALQ